MRNRALLATITALILGVTGLAAVPGLDQAVAQPVAQLAAVRAAGHPGYDRLVFQFAGPLPAVHSVSWAPRVVADASGKPLSLGGKAFLRVLFTPASAHTDAGRPTYAGPLPTQFDLPVLRSVKLAGDFEDVLSFGVGLWDKAPLHVFTLTAPPRLVVDITVPAGGPGRLGEVDNGRLVYLHAGQQITVALRTCVDCGYSWHVATAPDPRVVGLVKATVVPLPHRSGVVGFPYESRWTLRAAGAGPSILRLYELPPQPGAAPVARYFLRFAVTA